jgi:hypothetical protein
MAVFGSGCTLDAAARVCNIDHREVDVITELSALVHQGLLRRDEQADGEPGFAMLESIREYALERLAISGELERVQRAQDDALRLATALAGLASVAARDRDPAAWSIGAESLARFR